MSRSYSLTVDLTPELERFIQEQVRTGKFASPAKVLEGGLARLMLDQEPDVLDEKDLIRVRASIEEMQRGLTVDWKNFSMPMRNHIERG